MTCFYFKQVDHIVGNRTSGKIKALLQNIVYVALFNILGQISMLVDWCCGYELVVGSRLEQVSVLVEEIGVWNESLCL